MTKKRKMKICLSRWNSERINNDPRRWNAPYAKLHLKLTNPIGKERSIDVLDDVLNPAPELDIDEPLFECIGRVEATNPSEVWEKIQNIKSGHQLNDRSMMVGDVVIDEEKDEGFIVEPIGWSKLKPNQVKQFKKMPIRSRS